MLSTVYATTINPRYLESFLLEFNFEQPKMQKGNSSSSTSRLCLSLSRIRPSHAFLSAMNHTNLFYSPGQGHQWQLRKLASRATICGTQTFLHSLSMRWFRSRIEPTYGSRLLSHYQRQVSIWSIPGIKEGMILPTGLSPSMSCLAYCPLGRNDVQSFSSVDKRITWWSSC
jgi:hypothetical protein